MPNVSHSEVESYLTCRRKWWYGYGLSLQRVDTAMGMALGSAGHEVLAAFYQAILDSGSSRRAQRAAFSFAVGAANDKLDELYAGGWEDSDPRRMPLRKLILIYLANEPLVLEGYLILAVEREFLLEYDSESETRMPFVVDLIVETPDKRISIVDHKFVGKFYSDASLDLMPQIPKYIAGIRALGHVVHEGLYNLIKTTNIKGDKLLKAQIIEAIEKVYIAHPSEPLAKMTVDSLVSIAEAQGINVYAGPKVEQVLQQIPIKPNNVRVQQTFIEQIDTADEILRRKEMETADLDRVSFRTANAMVCNGCSFRELCATELSGGNTKLLLLHEYKVRERRPFDEVSEELEDA